jgi:hypothetical protein
MIESIGLNRQDASCYTGRTPPPSFVAISVFSRMQQNPTHRLRSFILYLIVTLLLRIVISLELVQDTLLFAVFLSTRALTAL